MTASGDPEERSTTVRAADVDLERDVFLRRLLRHLAGSLQDVVGVPETSGFISLVGQQIGREIDASYRGALQLERLDADLVSEVLVDLKRRIEGDFYILEQTPEKIVLGNRRCPFGDLVTDRPALCMMTSNVFGVIASENLGYARVVLDETIARGAPQCRVTIYLKPTVSAVDDGREYFREGSDG